MKKNEPQRGGTPWNLVSPRWGYLPRDGGYLGLTPEATDMPPLRG